MNFGLRMKFYLIKDPSKNFNVSIDSTHGMNQVSAMMELHYRMMQERYVLWNI